MQLFKNGLPSLILFKEDWDLPNNRECVVDYQTKNKSFLELAGMLHKMNIENESFHLQLHNRALIGVDPFDKNLTHEQKQMIRLECSTNYFYIIREIIKLTVTGTPEPVSFELNRASLATFWSFFIGLTIMVVLQRQTGKTVTIGVLISILVNFALINADVNLITKDSTVRGDTVDKVKDVTFNLPEYLQLTDKSINRGSERFVVKPLQNELKTHLAQRSKLAANNVGRGLTSPVNIFDEFGFLYNLKTMLTAAITSGTKARELAEANGLPFGTLFFTTASYLHTEVGRFAHGIYSGAFRFTEELYDCSSKQEVRDIVRENSTGRGNVLLIEYSHRQLNKTDAWLKQIIEDNMADAITASAEFMNIWVDATQSSALTPSQVKRLMESRHEPVMSTVDAIVIRWYIDEATLQQYKNGRSCIFGVDSSDMVSGDSTSLAIVDPTSGATIGTAKFRKSLISDFAVALGNLLIALPNSVLIIETRSSGMSILDIIFNMFVKKNINIFYKVFNWLIQEDVTTNNKYTNNDYISNKRHFGYKTGAGTGKNSRKQMYDFALSRVVDTVGHVLNDKDLINDLCALEEKDNKISHSSSRHDDTVVSRLLCDWLMFHGKHLDKYNINKLTVLSNITISGKQLNKDTKKIEEITFLLDELYRLKDKIKPIKMLRIKTKILKLKRKLKSESVRSLNIDAKFDEVFGSNI